MKAPTANNDMTEFIQVITTTGTRHDAERIASELVSRRLAGCVQVDGPISSTFRWQDKLEMAEEWTCTVKTSRSQFPAIQKLLDEIHPYEVPELIATPVTDGSEAYLKWLAEQLNQ
ncbi:MAG TPA: divalent-cation tolerance protein CutA [Lacipirellulaceae bacterium]|nr:divalent-cation tolerance protein CutA [Lacipirellulaceae bacterium]